MSNRHLARSLVMQTLFQRDFTNCADKESLEDLDYYINEFAPGVENPEFMQALTAGVLKKRTILDEIIGKAAPEWPVDKINAVDRNIIRLGLYELLFGDYDQVPPKVAINESIELAKSYGGESSSRFVNGVLGAIYKEIGEPGKEQKSKRQQQKEEIDLDSLPVHQKAGGVVYTVSDTGIQLAMVHDVFGYWTLSKGTVEKGETPEETMVREVHEEMGLVVTVKESLGENEYMANHPQDGKIRKQVKYYLAELTGPMDAMRLEPEQGGLVDVKWFPIEEVADLRMYDDITQMITKATGIILSNAQ
ncbi:MAG: N utilization substance protein B [Planctomycetota bacterium]|jgi:N utilization substance protein B